MELLLKEMPHNHSSSKQSRLRVRANPPGTSTPSQKPLLRLLRAAGSWLEGTAWSQAWVRLGRPAVPWDMPACPRALRRGLSLKGSLCPPNSLYSPFTPSQDVGKWLAGENPHIYWVSTHQCCLLCAGCSLLAYCSNRAST